MADVDVERWDESRDGSVNEAALRVRLERSGYVVSRYTYAPGICFPDHAFGRRPASRVDVSAQFLELILRLLINRRDASIDSRWQSPGSWAVCVYVRFRFRLSVLLGALVRTPFSAR